MVVLHIEPASALSAEANAPKMTAKAILTCRPNSHPFQDRTLLLDQPVKVGRSVARARPAPNNAIFDCKVLSRNHALLWYEDGKFFLQDTKSSNGTFVNNQRLSKGSEESTPREVCSGDIVQFGVDVMENSRKGKVTHGCIVATLKIYLPDGKEAKASPSTAVLPSLPSPGSIPTQELYQLSQYLQEALHREQMLESKLSTLQKLVTNSQEASECGWKALIDEDRLLTRLEILENQLQTYSKNFTDDKLRDEVAKLQEDKNNYQVTAKESLRKVLQEKLEAVRKLQDVEHSLTGTEIECSHVRETYENTQKELQELAEKYNNQLRELQELTDKLQDAEDKHKEIEKMAEEEKETLQEKLQDMLKKEGTLTAKIESLEADNDFTKEQLLAVKARMDSSCKEYNDSVNDNNSPVEKSSQEIQVDLVLEKIEGDMEENLKGALRQTQDEIDKLRYQLRNSESELKVSQDKVTELQKQLDNAQRNAVQSMNKVSNLEVQLQESKSQGENSNVLTKQLQDQICKLEEELKQVQADNDTSLLIYKNDQNQLQANGTAAVHLNHIGDQETNITNSLKAEIEKLKEILAETREKKKIAETEVEKFKSDLEEAKNAAKKSAEETASLRHQLSIAQQTTKDKSDSVAKLQEQLNKAELSYKDVKQQILVLKGRLVEEQQRTKGKQDEIENLRQQILELQQTNKQSHNEAEQLRNKIRALSEELDKKQQLIRSGSPHPEILDNRNSVENGGLKEQVSILKNRIHELEAELKKFHNENAKLQSDHKNLQDSYKELQYRKQVVIFSESDHPKMKGDNKEQSEDIRKQFSEAQEEILQLKIEYNRCNEEKSQLKQELECLDEEYQLLSYQTRTVSACSIIPLILLALSVFLAFYPSLARVTATAESSDTP